MDQRLHARLAALEQAARQVPDVATAALLWARVLNLLRQADGDAVLTKRCDKLGSELLGFGL